MEYKTDVLVMLNPSKILLNKALDLGCIICLIESPSISHPEFSQYSEYYFLHDLLDIPGLLSLSDTLSEKLNFLGVVTNHEPACIAAEEFARHHNLRSPGDGVAALLRDKTRMRSSLEKSSTFTLPWKRLDNRDDLIWFIERYGVPSIAKPIDGSASLGVLKIDSYDEVHMTWEKILKTMENNHKFGEVLPIQGYFIEK